jgi:pSer/pThr/pTyr-binding forkhead associated (FHA) protein
MGEVSEQQILRVDDEVVIGRVDHHTDFLPDLNLTRFGAWERGVSRLHAAIRRSGDTLLLVDLGSTNGTYLNGDRLTAREVRELRDGDRIRLGLFEMEIYYQQPAQDEPDVSLQ